MNRAHTRDSYLRTLDRLRAARPDIALSGDFIVGFPGETDADFAATLALVREVGYAQAYSFKYSPRPGTPAAAHGGPGARDGQGRAPRRAAGGDRRVGAGVQPRQRRHAAARCCSTAPGAAPGQLIGKSPWLQSVFVVSPRPQVGDMATVDLIDAQPNSLEGAPVP